MNPKRRTARRIRIVNGPIGDFDTTKATEDGNMLRIFSLRVVMTSI
jgi:hypothetical protein